MNNITFAIFGAFGRQGIALVRWLTKFFQENSDIKFVLIDNTNMFGKTYIIDEISKITKNFYTYFTDISKSKYLKKFLEEEGVNVCIGALPSNLQYSAAKIASGCGAHYFDLGANNKVLEKQRGLGEKFEKNGHIIMPFCGFDPGVLNELLISCARKIDCAEIKVYVGCIPADRPNNEFHHEWTFNIKSTLETYIGDVFIIEDGKIKNVKALEGYREINIENRRFEAFQTNCGNGDTIKLIASDNKLKNCEIFTVRYPGHLKAIEKYLTSNSFNKSIFSEAQKIPYSKKDMAFLRIIMNKDFGENGKIDIHKVCEIEWIEYADNTQMAIEKVTAGCATLFIKRVLDYINSGSRLSGFMLPETFSNDILNLGPEDIVGKLQEYGFNITLIPE